MPGEASSHPSAQGLYKSKMATCVQDNGFSCMDEIITCQFLLTQVLKRVSRLSEEFRVVFLDEGGPGAKHDVRVRTGEEEHNILISILQRSPEIDF